MHDDIEDYIHDVIKSQALNHFKPLLYEFLPYVLDDILDDIPDDIHDDTLDDI